MGTQLKRLSWIFAIQVACVGLGFWVQYQFLRSFSQRSASQVAWNEIASASSEIVSASRASQAEVIDVSHLLSQIRAAAPEQTWQATLVDADWQIVDRASKQNDSLGPGTTITWQPAGLPQPETNVGPVPGIAAFPDGLHAASVFNFSDSPEAVLIHVPLTAVNMTTSEAFKATPMAMSLALLWTCTSLGICTYMIGSRIGDAFEKSQLNAETDTLQKAQSLLRTQDAVIFGLANLAESRDPETGEHLQRIALYATALAQSLRNKPKFRDVVDEEFVRLIGTGSALHDIGKVGIEDAILRKPGRLSNDERKEIQRHPLIGSECLLKIERRLGASNFLQMAREIAHSHHEWWNGSGYPDNLIGNEIPIAARIVAIADVYDALATRRVYKPDLPHIACVGFIERGRGTQFDPDLVDAFLEVEQQFRRIAEQYSDFIRPGAESNASSTTYREHVDTDLGSSLEAAMATLKIRN
ncbi:Cyclic di-GMP phosphodiesterase response regulator RpfG [Symmachiella macrocystis]|uniref:Cyclic di-GMP phosphodiesterase response regulator RpfG n=1 Tax=Symmachiella macrocystis TaxID=2527985 RepID=A0A5C6BW48_9PLAN|nr:HD domain-containing phosphohydrolase [Symmachiella macrocystis]TWU14954.1 Cyclic di-GMP phosphodiesterase response regulator RpfG [Symmachiella macrocystis]